MRYPKLVPVINIIFAFILSASQADACSELVKRLKSKSLPKGTSLCDLSDRYQKALSKLESHGVQNPERIADIHATRFINYPDWVRGREKQQYSPWMVYGPAPQTWQSWENGASVIEEMAQANQKSEKIKPLNFAFLSKLHKISMTKLSSAAGHWRTGIEIGKSISIHNSIPENAVNALLTSEFVSYLDPKKPLVTWRATECLEDRTEEYRTMFNHRWQTNKAFYLSEWPKQDAKKFFTAKDGSKKQCGYLVYADASEVDQQMAAWMTYMNRAFDTISYKIGTVHDPLLAISRIQRWFISIHPYEDGNGRMSRYFVDYILRSLNLPSPIIKDFDDDLYFTSQQWAQEIGEGIVKAVQIAETCAAKPSTLGCKIVGKAP